VEILEIIHTDIPNMCLFFDDDTGKLNTNRVTEDSSNKLYGKKTGKAHSLSILY
jgi:hypothetical protein